ncbi:MAG TPA: hypothetical protein VHC72_01035 [Bryobacteraceae bacterium]|nr:hypothetical protein [Bryobacteraceae bacterium]
MVVTSLPVAAVPVAAAPAPVPVAAAPPQMLFTGMLQQLLSDIAPPAPVATPPDANAAEKQPVRLPLREDREPPRQEKEDKPAPQPTVNLAAVAPVVVPIPPPPPLPALPPPPPPIEDAHSAPLEKASDSPIQPATPSPTPEPAVVVAVRNTDIVVRAPEVRASVPEQRHEEIPEHPAAPAEPAELVVVARPPMKAEASKPAAMPEPVVVEKPPVRSVAIEFRPDGTHDVRVRLAEHAGEVHVSVHSADPVVTQNLQEGVTGLAATLAQAGYDARAWTPDQGQKQQQPREEREAKREKRTADTKFEGALEEVSR